jgi:divalent metal cation (Fe/Co/Zn/Cd) transporter
MSTVGNVVFSFIMMAVSFVLIVESIQDIATHASSTPGSDTNTFHVPAVLAVTVAFLVKFCLFCYCWGLREYPLVSLP